MEAGFRFACWNFTHYHLGDTLQWEGETLHWPPQRPPGGHYDGEGFAECPNCQHVFGVRIHVQSDIIRSAASDPTQLEDAPDPNKGEVAFSYRPDPFGWVNAYIADGTNAMYFVVSCILGDPLLDLMSALSELLHYGGVTRCRWYWEPAESRWILRREGEMLNITILGFHDMLYAEREGHGKVEFATTCDLCRFVTKVRLVASRVATDDEYRAYGTLGKERHAVPRYDQTPEFHALGRFLEERKRQG